MDRAEPRTGLAPDDPGGPALPTAPWGLDARGRPLPAPGVRLGPDFLARVAALARRRSRRRASVDGPGGVGGRGRGFEFAGYRPYRPGEDVRAIDWALYAREDRAFVRTTRREHAARARVFVDTSASMGLGWPGKLQRAAEIALARSALWLREGSEVRVRTGAGYEARLRRPADLERLVRDADAWRAGGDRGLAAALPSGRRDADRWLVVGDLADLDPERLARRAGRAELEVVQVLAPEELVAPAEGTAVLWSDPESTERRAVVVTAASRARFARGLERERDAWRRLCRARRGAFVGGPTTRPFERFVLELDRWTAS